MSVLQRTKQSSTAVSSIQDIDFDKRNEPAGCDELRLNMFHATKSFQIFWSVMAQAALVMSTIPLTNSAYRRATPVSKGATAPNSVADILQYISIGWDTLTRTMNRCESLEDIKTGGEAVMNLPAGMAVPAAIPDPQNRWHGRRVQLPP